jgi:hypothetical protein
VSVSSAIGASTGDIRLIYNDGSIDGFMPYFSLSTVADCSFDYRISESGVASGVGVSGSLVGVWNKLTNDDHFIDVAGRVYDSVSATSMTLSTVFTGTGWSDAVWAGSGTGGYGACGVQAGSIVCFDNWSTGKYYLPSPPTSAAGMVEVIAKVGSVAMVSPAATSSSTSATGFVCGIDVDGAVHCSDQHSTSDLTVPPGRFIRVRSYVYSTATPYHSLVICGLDTLDTITCANNWMSSTGWQAVVASVNDLGAVDFAIDSVSLSGGSVSVKVANRNGRVGEYAVR